MNKELPCPQLKALANPSNASADLSKGIQCLLVLLLQPRLPETFTVDGSDTVITLSDHKTILTALAELCGDGFTTTHITSLFSSGSDEDRDTLQTLDLKPNFLSNDASLSTEDLRELHKVLHAALTFFRQYALKKQKTNSFSKRTATVGAQFDTSVSENNTDEKKKKKRKKKKKKDAVADDETVAKAKSSKKKTNTGGAAKGKGTNGKKEVNKATEKKSTATQKPDIVQDETSSPEKAVDKAAAATPKNNGNPPGVPTTNAVKKRKAVSWGQIGLLQATTNNKKKTKGDEKKKA